VSSSFRLIELIKDWFYLIGHRGLKSALPEIIKSILHLPYRHMKFLVFERSLLDLIPSYNHKIDLEIREFKANDLVLIQNINRPSEVNLCARRLKSGHRGFIALLDNQVVGYAWACSKIEPKVEKIRDKIGSGEVLCVDAYTFPALRGKGVHTALTLARLRLFQELGFLRAIADIEVNNLASQAVWKKLGGKVRGYLDYKRIGTWRKISYLQ